MLWTNLRVSARKAILLSAVLCITVVGLIAVAQLSTADASTSISAASSRGPVGTFPGTNVGAIPDGLNGTPPQFGAPRVVSFAVSGITAPITDIDVDYTLTHSFVGDVEAILAAPGGSPSMHIATRLGVTTVGSFGDSSNYGATYVFDDSAAGTNIWSVATNAGCGTDCIVAAGSYRTTAPGQTGQTNPAPVTSLQTTFGGLTTGQVNGTWTLTFRDAAGIDTGSVSAANLIIDGTGVGPVADAPVDFNGDGRSDFVVVRNVGGGPTGQVRWFYNLSSGGDTVAKDWGLGSDFFIAEDFDNDNVDDIAVWRPGQATVAAFYILNSATNTARVEAFGQTGDDPTVVDDYDGDGRADLAVYRAGTSAGQQSVWYHRTSPGGPLTYTPWGLNGDFPVPGDYDGDGRADFVIQRDSSGQGIFWRLFANGAMDNVLFGLPTDVTVPGDYDDDGKTDIAVVRNTGGSMVWYYEPSSVGGVSFVQNTFGNFATDFAVPADYDGDGRTEIAVWRAGVFWLYNLQSGAVSVYNFGSPGDYPVANFTVH